MEVLKYYVVYDGYDNKLISKHNTKRSADTKASELIDKGEYQEVGVSTYDDWLKNDKMYYPSKYQEDVFGRMGDIFRPMAKGGTMNPFEVKTKKFGSLKRYTIVNKNTGVSFGRFKNKKDAEHYLDVHYMAKGGMTTFDDKVQAISKRLEGTKVPKRLEKDYGKRYNHEEAVEAGRRIAGAMRKKYEMAEGGTVGESKYTDAEIRRAMKNFFINPNKIEIIQNDDAYFAVVTEDFFINDEWYINYDEYGETVYKYFSHIREYNYPNDLRILLYYPIKKGYELDSSADVLEDDSEYFEN